MKKKYLLISLVIIIVLVSIYFLNQSTNFIPFINSGAQDGENKTSSPFNLPFRLPWQQPTETPENTNKSGGSSSESSGNGSSSSSGGSKPGESSTNKTKFIPTINYTLNINSNFEDLDMVVVYYLGGDIQNITSKPPYSVNIDANTTACVAVISSYLGTFWEVNGTTYEKTTCAGYPNGCSIYMDTTHNVTLRQYS
jgi:hypothetical protein